MDYKPCKETCSTEGCSYLRRKGQRTCAKCHREAERRRRKDAKQLAERRSNLHWQRFVESMKGVQGLGLKGRAESLQESEGV